jgi:glycosyltransferase involved in cell wall biosynthesis
MKGHKGLSMKLPYIVSSRANPLLLENLLKDRHPILFEGIHTTYFLHTGDLSHRKLFVRLHNVEHDYYRALARQTGRIWKKIFYLNESRLLHKYEREIANKATLLAISEKEAERYRSELGATDIRFLPSFIGWDYPLSKEGVGSFCLYHGNLSVPENAKAATWLLEKVFNDVTLPLVIAGKNPPPQLEKLAHSQQHTCLVANPSEKEMQDLIQKAQINILPSFTETGIKFKLLNSVFCGRHAIVNDSMAEGTHLEPACHIAGSADAFKSILVQLFRKPFDAEEIRLREKLLHHYYNNRENARQLVTWIW